MLTQICVIPEHYDQALKWLEKLNKAADELNKKNYTENDRYTECFDMSFDVVIARHDDRWYVESIRSSEKVLKWNFKKAKENKGDVT